MGYLNLVGSFLYKLPVFRSQLDALAENDAQLKNDGWAQSTKCVFYQAAVPTGWTQDVTQNDKALRVVGSTGGGSGISGTALSATIVTAHSHALTTPADGGHVHAYANHTHDMSSGGNSRVSTTIIANNGGFLYAYDSSGPGGPVTKLKGLLATPGATTLGTEANHNHGAPSSSLTSFVFAYSDVIIGTKNAPSGTYTDLTSYWSTGTKVDFDAFVSKAQNDDYNYGNLMPADTVMIFGQAAASAGWTKLATVNDRMLRVVSGVGGGTGGTQLISSGVTLAHTHSLTAIADHTHTIPAHVHSLATDGSTSASTAADISYGYIQESAGAPGNLALCQQTVGLPTSSKTVYKPTSTSSGSGSTTAAGGHTHILPSALADFTLAYVDVIQCSKDSTGAPYSYQDLISGVFSWKKLVSYQRLDKLAKNDAYIQFHTTPPGTKTLFYMASPPSHWTKITSQHNRALRVVSGATGGSPGGGAHLMSDLISLAHTHTIGSQSDHTHSAAHTHPLSSGSKTIVGPGILIARDTLNMGVVVPGGVGGGGGAVGITSQNPSETPDAAGGHNHGGITDSQLTDVTLAYADVIWCSKD